MAVSKCRKNEKKCPYVLLEKPRILQTRAESFLKLKLVHSGITPEKEYPKR